MSCVLPNNLAKFKTGNSFHMAITLPAFGEVQAWVTVLSMARLFNMVRIGMIYSIMSEHGHSLIMSYVATREQDIKHAFRSTRHPFCPSARQKYVSSKKNSIMTDTGFLKIFII